MSVKGWIGLKKHHQARLNTEEYGEKTLLVQNAVMD